MELRFTRVTYLITKASIFALVFTYTILPIVFKYSTVVRSSLIYMNFVKNSNDSLLLQPEYFSLKCTRTLRLNNTLDNVVLGAWHILPQSKLGLCRSDDLTKRTSIDANIAFDDSRPIILYIHGNAGSRALGHRVDMYKRLAYELDYHIITFDYRSFGDSSPVSPTVEGLASDAKTVFSWLMSQENVTTNRLRVWGHSLGTGITMKFISELPNHLQPPRIVLEAPFDNIANAVRNHPFGRAYRFLPIFEYFFVQPIIDSSDFYLDSSTALKKLSTSTKILILHAEDDAVLPIKLGETLYKEAVAALGDKNAIFFRICASHKVGHKFLSTHDGAIGEVKIFFD